MFQYEGEAVFYRGLQEIVESEFGAGGVPLWMGFVMATETQKKSERVRSY